jgi:peroxiredoxin
MKSSTALHLAAAVLYILGVSASAPGQSAAAEIGSKVSNFQLADVSGEAWSLRSYSGKIVVMVFWSYKCPVSLSYDTRIEELQNRYGSKGVITVAIASSSNESPEEIRANHSNRGMHLPVLLDSEGNVAEKMGATHAPDVFILDGEGILRYRGALDNNKRPGENGRIGYAEEALDSILAGRDVRITETRPLGCSLKQGRAASGI